eukprot:1563977-Rhodomonas_salina.5
MLAPVYIDNVDTLRNQNTSKHVFGSKQRQGSQRKRRESCADEQNAEHLVQKKQTTPTIKNNHNDNSNSNSNNKKTDLVEDAHGRLGAVGMEPVEDRLALVHHRHVQRRVPEVILRSQSSLACQAPANPKTNDDNSERTNQSQYTAIMGM